MNWLRGLFMLGLAVPAFAQYAGPAILSRGEAPAAMATAKVDFSASVAITGSYTTGLAGVSTPDSKGQLANAASYGESLTVGLSGSHGWKHSHIGIAYSGSISHYATNRYFDGLSQGLSIGVSHQLTRHTTFSLRESAGMYSRFAPATISLNSAVDFDPSQSNIPTTDFYDNRTIYSGTQASLTWQKSSRLSFNIGAGYSTNIRRSEALFGSAGTSASADVQYRMSRRTTVGANYSYSHFGYTHSIGGADIHNLGLSLSMRLSRWSEFSFFGGASRYESSFQQTQPVDPNILAILCPAFLNVPCNVGPATYFSHSLNWAPNFSARVSRSFRRGVVYVNAGESITPGNGLFLTSRSATANVGYGYTGLRKWSLGVSAGYVTALSLGNVVGNYGQVQGSYSMSRQLIKTLSFVSSFSATQYQSTSFTGYNRFIYSASMGLGFSPHNIPIRFF